jgi:hypothetical protein
MSSIKQSNQPPNAFEPEDLKSLDKVLSIVTSLTKFINAKKIYTDNNPTLQNFARTLELAYSAYFKEERELLLAVEKYQLYWRDQLVYENDMKDESIAFLLFKDGIGEITIQRSITFDEMNKFVDIIKDEIHNYSPDVCVVDKLWRSDFENIHYQVIEDGLRGEQRKGQGGSTKTCKIPLEINDHENLYNMVSKADDLVYSRAKKGSTGAYFYNLFYNNPLINQGKKEDHIQHFLDSYFKINEQEIKIWENDLTNEKKKDKLILLLKCMADFIITPSSQSLFDSISNILERVVDHLISESNPRTLHQALNILRSTISAQQIIRDSKALFKRCENKLINVDYLIPLGKDASRSEQHADDYFKYLQLIGDKSIKVLCELFELIDDPLYHRKACNTLLAISRRDIISVIDTLNTDNPQIARDVVYLFRKINLHEIPPLVRELIYYPDALVKEELICLLSDIGNEESQLLLYKFAEDENENVRIKTLIAISNIKSPRIIDKVKSLATSKQLAERSIREQEQIFRSLGQLMSVDAIPLLTRLTSSNKLKFLSKKHKHHKLLAICALEEIHDSKASVLLKNLTKDRDGLVRSKAKKALVLLEKRLSCNYTTSSISKI